MEFTIEQCDDDLYEVVDSNGNIVFTGTDDECDDYVIDNGGSL